MLVHTGNRKGKSGSAFKVDARALDWARGWRVSPVPRSRLMRVHWVGHEVGVVLLTKVT